jgi:(1->4)-alpha-D-glucan 1-alpha-D-glucosylmutase
MLAGNNSICEDPAKVTTVHLPTSTYRFQFNHNFTLEQAGALVDYLADLGITDCYVSPLTLARPGSPHGYDVTDHSMINPELGGEDQFVEFAHGLRTRGMGLILDTVPNHMCIAHPSNRWWADVLENGPSSLFARFFDIDWDPPKADLKNKVLLSVLGDQYGKVLENQELKIAHEHGAFALHFYEFALPVAPRTWILLLEPALEQLRPVLGESDSAIVELTSIITALTYLPLRTETETERVKERLREKEVIKGRLWTLTETSPNVRAAIDASLTAINGVKGDPRSFDRLEKLLEDEAYRLSFWHVAADEINYRRFFDINELAAIRVEQPEVFEAVHRLPLRLLQQGLITGLRIDHVDGLLDPAQYLRLLQKRCAEAQTGDVQHPNEAVDREGAYPFYVIVEKILTGLECLPTDWPVYGTTGYEFLNTLNGVFVEDRNVEQFGDLYGRFIDAQPDFRDLVYECKRLVLRASMSGEQNVLARRLDRISEQHRWSRDFTLNSLGRALAEVVACFPVYRSYVTSAGELTDDDRRYVRSAINRAKRRNPALSASVFDFLASVLLLEHPDGLDDAARAERLQFTLQFQQLTGPVTAKGYEDTALYRFYPLASLNEVGGDPASFGLTLQAFHARNAQRLEESPHGLSATSTHDTKRSEDVRARINVLSEIPDEWERAIWRWHHLNDPLRLTIEGGTKVPDPNEEYLFYQTLLGTWPISGLDSIHCERYLERIQDYLLKASKEAKVHTSWISPNYDHDRGLVKFVEAAMRSERGNRFLADFAAFAGRIARAGMLNSLSQVLLKITSPGVPDFYQGNELWDLSLVDPDNRRPVDYAIRQSILAEITHKAASEPLALTKELFERPNDGRIKMYVTCRALGWRRKHAKLFREGAYVPLEGAGPRGRQVIAFGRGSTQHHVIVAAGRFFTGFGTLPQGAAGEPVWSDTFLSVPGYLLQECYLDLFTGQTVRAYSERDAQQLRMSDIFAHMPVSVLIPLADARPDLLSDQSLA